MKSKYESLKSLIDMFLLLAAAFSTLYFLSLMLMSEESKKKSTIEAKAEFLITMTWETNDDVDLYLEDPNGALIFFNRREDGLMHLDRDDRGHQFDTIILPNGKRVEVKLNQEIASIRGLIPGEFVSNIHMYSKRGVEDCVVTVKIEKINPYSIVWIKDYTLSTKGQREIVCRFEIAEDGSVTEVNELDKDLLNSDGDSYYYTTE